MNRSAVLKISLSVSLLFFLCGLVTQILHYEEAYLPRILQTIGLFLALIFSVTAVPEVWKSHHIPRSEKVMWTIGFFSIIGFAGILYLTNGRRRVLKNSNHSATTS